MQRRNHEDTGATVQRFVRAAKVPAEMAWRIIVWCAERGGEEFSLRFLSIGGRGKDPLEGELAPFHLGEKKREHLTSLSGEELRRPASTWKLCPNSIEILRRHWPEIFAAPDYAAEGWFEDFTIYRRGELMLGVVSHEELVVVHFTEAENRDLARMGVESYETPA